MECKKIVSIMEYRKPQYVDMRHILEPFVFVRLNTDFHGRKKKGTVLIFCVSIMSNFDARSWWKTTILGATIRRAPARFAAVRPLHSCELDCRRQLMPEGRQLFVLGPQWFENNHNQEFLRSTPINYDIVLM